MTNDILIKKIKDFLFDNKEIEFAFLFGSYAIEKETPLSDIDIAVYQNQNKSKYDLRKTELKIEINLTLEFPLNKFDVRSLNDAPIIVTGKIINEGTLLFFHNEKFYYDYLVNMRMRYLDYLLVYNPLFNNRYENLLNDR